MMQLRDFPKYYEAPTIDISEDIALISLGADPVTITLLIVVLLAFAATLVAGIAAYCLYLGMNFEGSWSYSLGQPGYVTFTCVPRG